LRRRQAASWRRRECRPPAAGGRDVVADHSGALSLASGILAALFARERTGKGQKVDAVDLRHDDRDAGMEINYTSITGTSRSARKGASIYCTALGRVP